MCCTSGDTYFLVITDEYIRHGTAKTQLINQIIAKNILAFLRDVLCCNGLTIAMYLITKLKQKLNICMRAHTHTPQIHYLSNDMATNVNTELATETFAMKLFIVQ